MTVRSLPALAAHSRTRLVAQALSFGVVIGLALLALANVRDGWWFQDAEAYWNAALRLREGQPLYPSLESGDASDTYRYAPWFAAAWVPVTFLPQTIVYVAWVAALMAATAVVIWPALRTRSFAGLLLAVLLAALLVPASATGNVQSLMLASLVIGLERRSGPLWIAAAASLKATPILLAAVYVGRRQWARAALAVALSALLAAPMLAFDLSHYPRDIGAAAGPLEFPVMAALAAVGTLVSLRLAPGRFGWLAAGVAVLLAMPRWSYYQPTFVAVGLAHKEANA
jgi:hypothetical protein